jgi:hypothetical protein
LWCCIRNGLPYGPRRMTAVSGARNFARAHGRCRPYGTPRTRPQRRGKPHRMRFPTVSTHIIAFRDRRPQNVRR